MKKYKTPIYLSYIHLFIVNISGLVLLPFIISMIGKSEYGLYALIGTFIALITIFDFGLNSTTVRYISQYNIQKDKKSEKLFVSNVFQVYLTISILLSALLCIFYLNVDSIYKNSFSMKEQDSFKTMVLILIFNVLVTIPGKLFEGIVMAYERFTYLKVLAIVKALARILLLLLLINNGSNAIGIILIDTFLNVFYVTCTSSYVTTKLGLSLSFYRPRRADLVEIFKFTSWAFVFAVLYQTQWNIGQVVLGIVTGTETVAVFAVGVSLGLYHLSFSKVINGFLLPNTVRQVYENVGINEHNKQLVEAGRLILPIALGILLLFSLIGKEFIYLWLGDGFAQAWIVALLIMSTYTQQQPQGYIHTILEARKQLKFKAITMIVGVLLGLFTGYMLYETYNELGYIAGVVTTMFITNAFLDLYYRKSLNINIVLYYKQVFLPMIVPSVAIFVLCQFLFQFITNVSWLMLLFKVSIFLVVYSSAVYFFYFGHKERNFFRKA